MILSWTRSGNSLVVEEKLRSAVLEIYNVALFNRQSPLSLMAACASINIYYEQFLDIGEQGALIKIYAITIRETKYWLTTVSQANLKEILGWDIMHDDSIEFYQGLYSTDTWTRQSSKQEDKRHVQQASVLIHPGLLTMIVPSQASFSLSLAP